MKPIHSCKAAVLTIFAGAVLFKLYMTKPGPGSATTLRSAVSHSAAPEHKRHLAENYGKLPLSFEANQGQMDGRVKFLSRGRGYALFLTGDAAVFSLRKAASLALNSRSAHAGVAPPIRAAYAGLKAGAAPAAHQPGADNDGPPPRNPVLRMRLVGANVKATVVGAEELPGKSNYFIGNDPGKWRTNVPNYAKVKCSGVYPGVDLVYYGDQGGQLEYDFVVAPGADPTVIALEVATASSGRPSRKKGGVKPLHIAADGDLVIGTPAGEVSFHKPLVYQPARSAGNSPVTPLESQSVTGRYVLRAGNQVGFEVGVYDRTRPLVIDPVLIYSTYLGGSDEDGANGIAVDAAGDAYVVGQTRSLDFPTVNPAQPSYTDDFCDPSGDYPCYDAFVSKLDPTGSTLVYSTYLGGTGQDVALAVAVDPSGNAYVTGLSGGDFPTTPGSFQPPGAHNLFLAKLGPAGTLVYSSVFGASGIAPFSRSVAVDSSGNAYATGNVSGVDFPTTPGSFQPKYAGGNDCAGCGDVFVLKLNPSGSAAVYATYLGGAGEDVGYGIAADSFGNAYVTGSTQSTDFPLANAFQSTCANCGGGLGKAFLTKLNAAGSALIYSTYLGGASFDTGQAIAIDGDGSAYLTGVTESVDFPVLNPISPSCAYGQGATEGFLTKFKPDGTGLVYSTCLAGTGFVGGWSLAVDAAKNAYVAGITGAGLVPVDAIETSQNACCTFLMKVNSAGSSISYATYFGGSTPLAPGFNVTLSGVVAADTAGNAYLAGRAQEDLPTTLGAFQTQFGGGGDAYIAKISPNDAPGASFAPSGLIFASQPVGSTSNPETVAFFNTGSAPLTISGMTVTGDFALAPITTCDSQIPAASNCLLALTFTPTSSGPSTGSLAISDTAAGNPHVLQLTGTTIPAAPFDTLSTTYLAFPGTTVGLTSAAQSVTLTNTGAAPLVISNISVSAPFSETNNCPAQLAARAACTLTLTFAPTSPGGAAFIGLTITSNAPDSPSGVFLIGSGIPPTAQAAVSPAALNFGSQPMGTTSNAQIATLSNPGTGPLTIAGIATSVNFGQTNNCGSTLAADGSCAINVIFAPTATGPFTGTLTITDNGLAGSSQTVALSGTGTGPAVSLSPNSLTFAAQMVGTSSAAQTLTLTNTGTGSLTISSITASGDYSQTNTCGVSVSASANCNISVVFKPTAAGTRTGTLSIADNAAGSPQSAALSGTGQDFSFAPPSGSSTSASAAPGQSATYTLSVGGEGGLSGTVTFTCTGAPSEATCAVSPNPATAGSSATPVTVTVTTTAPSLSPPRSRLIPPVRPISPGLQGLLTLALILAAIAWAVTRRSQPGMRRWHSALLSLAAGWLLALALAGCGGGGGGGGTTSNPGTPAGTYSLTVTGTTGSGSSALSHSVTLTLTVS